MDGWRWLSFMVEQKKEGMRYICTPLIIVATLVFLSGCNKDEANYRKLRKKISGDYDWVLSMSKDYTSIEKPAAGPHYGVRIKSNGNAACYYNGEIELEGSISHIGEYEGVIYFTIDFHDLEHRFRTSENGVRCETYPFDAIYNDFVKL